MLPLPAGLVSMPPFARLLSLLAEPVSSALTGREAGERQLPPPPHGETRGASGADPRQVHGAAPGSALLGAGL